ASHGQQRGFRGQRRNAWNWRRQNGWSRWGRNSWHWSQAGVDGYWGSSYGYADPSASGGDGPPIAISAPALDVYLPAQPTNFDPSSAGGCVIHKLVYDQSGQYV